MFAGGYFPGRYFADPYFGKVGGPLVLPQVITAHVTVERASMCAIDVLAASAARVSVERASTATISLDP